MANKVEKIEGLKVSLCQMNVTPGRPDINATYIISEIKAAKEGKMDIIIFPEMAVPGYVIGDKYEEAGFIQIVEKYNDEICRAATGGIIVVFGSIVVAKGKKGEDGRIRKYNAAIVAQNGKRVGYRVKTFHPNFRFFQDDRHFYSLRKIWAEMNCKKDIREYYRYLKVKTRIGKVKLGIILCEDMWHEDYPFNPSQILANKGADLLINISASPWTWQKNRKRHSVVKDLFETGSGIPFIYVNNMGLQTQDKIGIVFDGSSTIYNQNGEIIHEVPAYSDGSHDFEFKNVNLKIKQSESSDTAELFQAINCGATEFLHQNVPLHMRKIIVGLSGGIDSALSAAIWANIVGPENVYAINMPSQYNSEETKDIARQIAENLGVSYEVIPIQKIVDNIAEATGVIVDTLAYENIQARVRMEILAAKAQQIGGVFTCNSNKVECAFGYGTMYADIAGFFNLLCDLVKREVYQIADHLNKHVYNEEIIPQACFDIAPTAELKKSQKDPFHYGNLNRRGYHDEMVRAYTEFRWGPDQIISHYKKGMLEDVFQLETGTIATLFPAEKDFHLDLERTWKMFHGAYFKRLQAPPHLVLTKRAFCEMKESFLSPIPIELYKKLI